MVGWQELRRCKGQEEKDHNRITNRASDVGIALFHSLMSCNFLSLTSGCVHASERSEEATSS
jgi:hypothetical protein